MKLPRDVSGLTCEKPTQHHVTVPHHDPLRIGTLAAVLNDVANHHGLSREEVVARLFGR